MIGNEPFFDTFDGIHFYRRIKTYKMKECIEDNNKCDEYMRKFLNFDPNIKLIGIIGQDILTMEKIEKK